MPTRLEQLQQMLQQEPGDEFLQYAICMEFMSAGDFAKAADGLHKLLRTNENYLAAYYQLGKCLEALGQPAAARSIYEEGVKIAKAQGNNKTLNELNEALFLLED
jgi:tetratricopeptide (TPR) repeat protein